LTFDFGGTPDIKGTYDKLYIRNPDIYGGAYATKYPVAADTYGTASYTLTLARRSTISACIGQLATLATCLPST